MPTHVIRLDRYCAQAEGVRGRLVLGTWDSYGIEQLQLVLGDGWQGRTVTAVFNGPKTSAGTTVLAGSDGLVDVPQEATAAAGYGTITIVGVDADSRRISVDVPYVVHTHAPVDGTQPDPTPDQWQQFVAQVKADADRAEAAAAKLPDPAPADTGKSVVVQSDGTYGLALVQGGGGGTSGQDGGYYTPSIRQTTEDTAEFSWAASDDTMPPVDPVTLKLPQGPQGVPGRDGQDGAPGADGITPTIGANGNWYLGEADTGKPSRGPQGPAGQAGAPGEQGAKGDPGPQGEPGPKGDPGPEGPQGPQGVPGKDGTSFQVLGRYDTLGNLTEAHPTGTAGDAYAVGEETTEIYIWDVDSNTWENIGPLEGPAGPQGAQGPKGDTGDQGPQGPAGEDGQPGPAGQAATITVGSTTTGAPGTQAQVTNTGNQNAAIFNFTIPQGAQGPQGIPGPQGETGPQGEPGADGAQGPQGKPGAAAGFGQPTATVDDTTGTPSVQVTASGPDTAKIFDFKFFGLKGETGQTGPQGPAYTLTPEDTQTIVQAVLAALPNGDEVSY